MPKNPPLVLLRRCLSLLATAALLGSCNRGEPAAESGENPRSNAKLMVVTTTTMITDLVRTIAGDAVEIEPLMGPGVDPHLYQPTPEDIKKISRATGVVYSGLHLEEKVEEELKKLEAQDKIIIGLGDHLNPSDIPKYNGAAPDPHIWGDAKLWSQTIPPLVASLTKILPIRKEEFERNGRALQKRLMDTHIWLKSQVDLLPRRSRVLVTSHDAFQYFGRAYGFEVLGVQGSSTGEEVGLNEITHVIDTIKARGVKTIFIETNVPSANIQRISKETGMIIGGELLSDSLGFPGDMVDVGLPQKVDRGTLIGTLQSNMFTIVKALSH